MDIEEQVHRLLQTPSEEAAGQFVENEDHVCPDDKLLPVSSETVLSACFIRRCQCMYTPLILFCCRWLAA